MYTYSFHMRYQSYVIYEVCITVWEITWLERKDKREKLVAEGLEPRVFVSAITTATSHHSNQPLSILLSFFSLLSFLSKHVIFHTVTCITNTPAAVWYIIYKVLATPCRHTGYRNRTSLLSSPLLLSIRSFRFWVSCRNRTHF